MHVRNPYSKPPDFKQLAEEFKEFSEYVLPQRNGKYRVDFKDPSALRALTKVLLKKDFSLDIEIPENSIIPTVPQRLNYLLWMEDLLEKLPKRSQDVKGIDIGTGASCIFPLLGFRKNRWRFVATEIDEESRRCAEQNLKQNKLEDYITIRKVSKETIFKEIFEDCDEVFDFCFCNPPFFDDYDDQRKQKLPHCPKPLEVIVDGGEVSFVKRMIDDSLSFREKISLPYNPLLATALLGRETITAGKTLLRDYDFSMIDVGNDGSRIYSSMLGKKKSLKAIVNVLKNVEGVTYTTTNFCQGNTMRWGIAWTYLQIPDFNIETPKKKKKKEKRPLSFMIPKKDISLKNLLQRIKSILNHFQIAHRDIHVSKTKASLKIKSYQNTWTGQRRKRRELKRKMEGTSPVKCENEELQLRRSLCDFSPEITSSLGNKKRKMEGTSPVKCENEELRLKRSLCDFSPEITSSLTNQKRKFDEVGEDTVSPKRAKHDCVPSTSTSCDSSSSHTKQDSSASHTKQDSSASHEKQDSSTSHEKQDSSTSHEKQDSSTDSSEKPILNCQIHLTKVESEFIFQLSSDFTSNLEVMHQVFQLFRNKLNP